MANATEYFDMTTAPMRIASVGLKVRDLKGVSAFYQSAMGLSPILEDDHRVTLGTGSASLLELVGDTGLAVSDKRQAGLFHTAFLMPTRADLARWLVHAHDTGLRLQGASDHIVSEAIYLSDPEGNGIEVYVDRRVSDWHDTNGNIQMATNPLDIHDLLAAAGDTQWSGYPSGGSIGHVHLQVGDTAKADRFYRDILGFDATVDYPGASFYGSGGYHHQIAGNVWNSRQAGKRPEGVAGLVGVEIILRNADSLGPITARAKSAGITVTEQPRGITLHDPWGTAITLMTPPRS